MARNHHRSGGSRSVADHASRTLDRPADGDLEISCRRGLNLESRQTAFVGGADCVDLAALERSKARSRPSAGGFPATLEAAKTPNMDSIAPAASKPCRPPSRVAETRNVP